MEVQTEPSHTVATGSNHSNHSNRARELEMIASHANVVDLRLPPDLVALAYDQNHGELVDTLDDLTRPTVRRGLERELAERQERRYQSVHHPAPRGSPPTALSDRSYAHQVHHGEEEEGEGEEEEARQHALDLWLLESQVPGCTHECARRAYAQAREDVSRALPFARIATLLGDRETMVDFLMEQLPGSMREEARASYEEAESNVVDAAVNLQRDTRHRLNQPILSSQSKQRLRIRTVFALALLYRERYGQLDEVAEEAIAQIPVASREGATNLPSFTTPDGVMWTHSSGEGWEQRAAPGPAHVGRAAQATERLAVGGVEDPVQAQMSDGARQATTGAHARAQTALDAPHFATGYRRLTPQQAINERLRRQRLQEAHTHLDDAIRGEMDEEAARMDADVIAERQRAVINEGGIWIYGTTSPYIHLPEPVTRFDDDQWTTVHRRPPNPALWHNSDRSNEDSDEGDEGGEEQPPTLAATSSSSSEEEEGEEEEDGEEDDDYYDDDYYDDEGNERPTAGTYARPRPFARGAVRAALQHHLRAAAKRNLRIIQEQLDTEMANANEGIVMSEGAYVAMMNAVKAVWESVDLQPAG